jgi:hypothetical protein
MKNEGGNGSGDLADTTEPHLPPMAFILHQTVYHYEVQTRDN